MSFAVCNSFRVLAYVPQIVTIVRVHDGARAISYLTWISFTVSNLSTLAYALLVVSDRRMAAIFAANTACWLAIVAATACERIRHNVLPVAPTVTAQYETASVP